MLRLDLPGALLGLALIAGSWACSRGDTDAMAGEATGTPSVAATPAATDSLMALVAPAAAITLALREKPAREDSILAAAGFTRERYDSLLIRIQADSVTQSLYLSATGS